MVYTSQPSGQIAKVVEAFNKAHPKVQVSLYRSGTTEVMNRLQAEFAAGRPQADVVLVADAVATTQLKNDGRLLAYADAPADKVPAGADRSRQDLLRHQADHHRHRLQHQARQRARRRRGRICWRRRSRRRPIMAHPLYSGAAVIHVGTFAQQKDFGWPYFETLAQRRRDRRQGQRRGDRGGGARREGLRRHHRIHGVQRASGRARRSSFVFPQEGVSAITQPVAILKTAQQRRGGAAPSSTGSCRRRRSTSRSSQGYFPIFDGVAPPKGYPPVSSLQDHARRSARHPGEGRGEQEAVHRAVRWVSVPSVACVSRKRGIQHPPDCRMDKPHLL